MALISTHTISSKYLSDPASPIGFEVVFEVADSTAGIGSEPYVTCITIDTTNASFWSLDAVSSTGKISPTDIGKYERNPPYPAHSYDSAGISATWTEPISGDDGKPTRYFLRGKFDAPGGMIHVSAQTTQVADPNQSSGLENLAIAIATPTSP